MFPSSSWPLPSLLASKVESWLAIWAFTSILSPTSLMVSHSVSLLNPLPSASILMLQWSFTNRTTCPSPWLINKQINHAYLDFKDPIGTFSTASTFHHPPFASLDKLPLFPRTHCDFSCAVPFTVTLFFPLSLKMANSYSLIPLLTVRPWAS